MIQHTPGPWTVSAPQIHGCGLSVDIDAIGVRCFALATVVWQMEDDKHDDKPSDSCIANAHLIAAAPDLYKAIYRLIASSTPQNAEQRRCWKELYEAIAKAGGAP